LAYEVGKERKGIYLYWLYLATPGIVEEAERNLRMLDNVIRYLSVKVDDNVDVAARPIEIDETSFEKAATTAADEEDLFLSRGGDESRDDEEEDEYANYTGEEPAAEPAAEPVTEDKE